MTAMAARRRFADSLDMVAARPILSIDLVSSPISLDNAWSMVDSPVLGHPTDSVQQSGPSVPRIEHLRIQKKSARVAPVAPLNIKKARRKGLLSGVQLVLPTTPLPPSTPGMTPQTSLTFTAEWDDDRGYLFTPLSSAPRSAAVTTQVSPRSIPDDITEESHQEVELGSGLADHGHDYRPESPMSCSSGSSDSSSRSSCYSGRSLFSESGPLFIHERKPSTVSTCPSSVMDDTDAKTSESPCTREQAAQELVAQLEAEIHRTACVKQLDSSCLEGMDQALLLDPWSAFDLLCWESVAQPPVLADASSPVRQRKMQFRKSKPLPDVPSGSGDSDIPCCDEVASSRFSCDGLPSLAAQASRRAHDCGFRFHLAKALKFYARGP
ncbi:hypothetical protein WOLCODRAFT_140045 [Wolfiporia cocos MD-104 SS10]|uniref:Uncharacterized protein n=1 Tax=Wolfiporia cocos (strain MD-104) TaxID=742152 RepID=A0A2H3J0G3_WOLCO|nr:hypothetical protein WOLCODRAFT_140045 [Wolfiporia cocos MD-104 SS10]